MSYSILYRPMFLKVKENMYIPIYEGGDNNVWNYDNKSRAREWCNIRFKGMEDFYCSEQKLFEILNIIREKTIQDNEEYKKSCSDYTSEYSDRQFGYFNSVSLYGKKPITTSWNDYLNFFKKGIKNSITIEEANELKLVVRISHYDLNNKYNFVYIRTEEELFDTINLLKDKAKYGLWIGYSSVSDRTYDFINTLRNKRSYSKRDGWAIETPKGFIKSFDSIKPIFTNDRNEALKLISYKSVNKLGRILLKDDINWINSIKI